MEVILNIDERLQLIKDDGAMTCRGQNKPNVFSFVEKTQIRLKSPLNFQRVLCKGEGCTHTDREHTHWFIFRDKARLQREENEGLCSTTMGALSPKKGPILSVSQCFRMSTVSPVCVCGFRRIHDMLLAQQLQYYKKRKAIITSQPSLSFLSHHFQ